MAMKNENKTTKPEGREASLREFAVKAGPIAQNSHLLSINLRSMEVTLLAEPGDQRQASIHSEHRTEHLLKKADEEKAPSELRVRVHFSINVKANEDATELFRMKATFEALYALNRGMPEEAVAAIGAFASTNTMLHVWPYYRELVQATTWRMGIPPFPLPLFRISDSLPEKKNVKS